LLLQYLNRVSDLLWLMAREAETPPPGGGPRPL
jgi:cob(I)alamin adenosyltransferase